MESQSKSEHLLKADDFSFAFRESARIWWPKPNSEAAKNAMFYLIPDRLTTEEVAAVCQTIELMDWNSTGKVNASRICEVAKNLNIQYDETDAENFVRTHDLNSDGQLSFNELLFAFGKLKRIERYKRDRRYDLLNKIVDNSKKTVKFDSQDFAMKSSNISIQREE